MDAFVSTREMVERIKDELSRHLKDNEPKDWHVAGVLRISDANLASRIYRDSPPITEILLFCSRCGLNPLDIVMKKSC